MIEGSGGRHLYSKVQLKKEKNDVQCNMEIRVSYLKQAIASTVIPERFQVVLFSVGPTVVWQVQFSLLSFHPILSILCLECLILFWCKAGVN